MWNYVESLTQGKHQSSETALLRGAIVRGEGGLKVGHDEYFVPLYERVDSPTLGLLDS